MEENAEDLIKYFKSKVCFLLTKAVKHNILEVSSLWVETNRNGVMQTNRSLYFRFYKVMR